MSWTVAALCSGRPATLADGSTSAIAKSPLAGPVAIGLRGIETDSQVNRKYHGFAAMALHHYPHDHYPWLRESFDDPAPLAERGGFGENISTAGLTEDAVLIGDRFRLGSALIEVTQPRQPCATIERHLQRKGVVKAIVGNGCSGWFYRVLEPGIAQAGDALTRIEEGHGGWTVLRAFASVYGGGKANREELEALHALARVSDRLQLDIAKRLAAH